MNKFSLYEAVWMSMSELTVKDKKEVEGEGYSSKTM